MSAEWANVVWRCSTEGCSAEVTQRFHVPTDGRPEDADPPTPWAAVEVDGERVYLCPDCGRRAAAEDAARDDATAAYADVPRATAEARWAAVHLCLRCAHSAVCRHAPGPEGADLLVTIVACLAFAASPD